MNSVFGEALGLHRVQGPRFKISEACQHNLVGQVVKRANQHLGEVLTNVGVQHADGTQCASVAGNVHLVTSQAGADRCGPCVELVLDVRRPLARPLAADATGASSSEAAAAEGAAAAAEGGDVGRTGGTVVIIVIAAVQLARCAVAARCAALAEASGAEPAVQLA